MKRVALCVLMSVPSLALADWPIDAGIDVPVANVDTSKYPNVVADDQNGVFVVFSHADATPSVTLRGEHFNAAGDRLWSVATSDGGYLGKDLLGLTLGASPQGKAAAVTDADGGFIAVYTQGKAGGPFTLQLQRFSSQPAPLWTATGAYGGVQLLASPPTYDAFYAIPDQLGGALLFFGNSAGCAGQRLDGTGAVLYGNGYEFSACQYPGPFYPSPFVDGDGRGGMTVIWPDNGASANDPLIDHLDGSGHRTFEVASVAPATADFESWSVASVADGGAWASWWSGRSIFLQQFDSDGGAVLGGGANSGLAVAATGNDPPTPMMLEDGNGGVILAWYSVDAASGAALYAQHFGSDGSPKWGTNPVTVSSSASTPRGRNGYLPSFRFIRAPNGNPTLFWQSTPNGIFAEQLDASTGARLWQPLNGGVAVSNTSSVNIMDVAFAADGSAYLAYEDSLSHVYVKHVTANGELGTSVPDGGGGAGSGTTTGGSVATGGSGGTGGNNANTGSTSGGATTSASGSGSGSSGGASTTGSNITGGGNSTTGTTASSGGSSSSGNGNPDAGMTSSSSSGCSCSSTTNMPASNLILLSLGLLLRRRKARQTVPTATR